MKIPGQLYFPRKWECLAPSMRAQFVKVQDVLGGVLGHRQPTYEQLTRFVFTPVEKIKVRDSIAVVVQRRAKRSLSMTQEIACFRKCMREKLASADDTLYEAASKVRSLLFGKREALRTINMAIAWHDWMFIIPPMQGDPLFFELPNLQDGPPLYSALNLYLILLTSHPFTDGNGRTARLMFNLRLAQGCAQPLHYLPLAELTIATAGVYEECIATACEHGDFDPLMLLVLRLLESYAELLETSGVEETRSELAEVLSLVSARQDGTLRSGFNNHPPYLISVSNLLEDRAETSLNSVVVECLLGIAKTLSAYGSIDFALTGLADIADGVGPPTRSVAFFVKAQRKEELILHFRELRAKYRSKIQLQVVVASGDPAVDAKLLVALVSEYGGCRDASTSCPVLLHDFNQTCLPDR